MLKLLSYIVMEQIQMHYILFYVHICLNVYFIIENKLYRNYYFIYVYGKGHKLKYFAFTRLSFLM